MGALLPIADFDVRYATVLSLHSFGRPCGSHRQDRRISDIRQCFWRRGWDSNPRNGFPFTAFPVLPVQPLLHLSENIKTAGGEGGIRTHGGR